jgi:hypothetical protein
MQHVVGYGFLLKLFFFGFFWGGLANAGFVETRRACCGHGLLSTAVFCNSRTEGTCSDASKYVFFDSLHPTQAVYKRVAEDYEEKLFSFFGFNGGY